MLRLPLLVTVTLNDHTSLTFIDPEVPLCTVRDPKVRVTLAAGYPLIELAKSSKNAMTRTSCVTDRLFLSAQDNLLYGPVALCEVVHSPPNSGAAHKFPLSYLLVGLVSSD